MTIGILPGARAHAVQPHAVQSHVEEDLAKGKAADVQANDDFSATGFFDELKKLLPPATLPGKPEEVIRPKAFRPFV
jgi:hypothetical protein